MAEISAELLCKISERIAILEANVMLLESKSKQQIQVIDNQGRVVKELQEKAKKLEEKKKE